MKTKRLGKQRGTHVPFAKKYPPNPRLTKLRAILQKSRPEFAHLVGVPPHTLRSYERGDRRLPEKTAEEISYATWICSEWLLDDNASAEKPRAWGGSEYTLDFYQNFGFHEAKRVDVDGNPNLAIVYMRPSHRVARLMRAALSKRKHLACEHLLGKTISQLTKRLNLEDSFRKEMPGALQDDPTRTMMMGGSLAPQGSFNPDSYNAAMVLSSAMLFQWSAAVEGTEADRAKVLANLDSVKALIQQSFEKRPTTERRAAVMHSRKKPPASPPRPRKA